MRLEHERLVEIRPQRGTFVFDCDTDEVRAMCELASDRFVLRFEKR
jgi:DNA-binding GntR family transcriptional regulator